MAKILIVDDSVAVRIQVRKTLEAASHIVIEAADGIQGIQTLNEHPDTQLIFCDVKMPNMDGLAMCEKLKEIGVVPRIPVLMLTTESSPEFKTRGRDAGVLAWIVKPFVPEKLLTAVEQTLAFAAARQNKKS
jgi:two-component system, chemotaxis family, chemotaxis protein CheY